VYAYFESKNAILDAMFGEAAELRTSNAEPVEDEAHQQLVARPPLCGLRTSDVVGTSCCSSI
jgi:AcrR family transcriptional regulator